MITVCMRALIQKCNVLEFSNCSCTLTVWHNTCKIISFFTNYFCHFCKNLKWFWLSKTHLFLTYGKTENSFLAAALQNEKKKYIQSITDGNNLNFWIYIQIPMLKQWIHRSTKAHIYLFGSTPLQKAILVPQKFTTKYVSENCGNLNSLHL